MSTDVAPERTEVPSAREVRQEIRDWRRGRAELSCGEVLSERLRRDLLHRDGRRRWRATSCSTSGAWPTSPAPRAAARCAQPRPGCCARGDALALGVARLLGPVFSPPAANSWVLSTPVDRGALLRPGWVRTIVLTAVGAALLLVAPAVLGGFALARGGPTSLAGSTTAPGVRGGRRAVTAARAPGRPLADVAGHRVAVDLLALAATQGSDGCRPCRPVGPGGRGRDGGRGRRCSRGARPSRSARSRDASSARPSTSPPALSGALSSVDLGLMYDVLLARRWGGRARAQPHRGGPLGWGPWCTATSAARSAPRSPTSFWPVSTLVPYAAA